MGFTIRGKLDGAQTAVRRLEAVNAAVKKKVLRKAVARAARIVRKAAREKAPTRAVVFGNIVDLKLLKKSITARVKVYKNGNAVAIIGPREGMKTEIGKVSRGPNKGKPIYEDPANIGHLVEFGHGGAHPAPAHPFMRPAFDETKDQAAAAMVDEISKGIDEVLSGVA